MPQRAARVRSLLPREHGAWAQLGLPLATALLAARPTVAGVALACSACAAFLVHEPWLVLDGQRGTRALREDGARARLRLFVLLAISGLTGGLGLALGGMPVLRVIALPLVLGAAVAWFVQTRRERTFAGEAAAALALSALTVPVAVADGIARPAALLAFAAWSAVFVVGTRVVRGIVGGEGRRVAVVPALVFLAVALLSLLGTTSWTLPIALAPTCLVGVLVALVGVEAKELRRVGWVLAAASLVTAIVLLSH